jgi:hypothetical protein
MGRRGVLGASSLAVALSLGCFFELADVEPSPIGVGGSGEAGFGASGSGGSLTAGSGGDGQGAGGAGVPPCPVGQKDCGAGCVPYAWGNGCGSESCTPCSPLPQADLTCNGETNLCEFDVCKPGFADCDGDTSDYPGDVAGNGCEYSFGTIASSTDAIVAPRGQIRVDDNSRDDWNGIPAYRLEQTCVDCADNVTVFQPVAQNEAPPASDLSAYFRVSWDADHFYLLAEAFDDHLFNQGSTVDNGGCRGNNDYVPGPICEDAFAVYFDALQDGGNIGSNGNHRIFLGTSGTPFAPAQGQPPQGTVVMRVLPSNGPRCYRMEAQFDWRLLVSSQGEPIAGKFPPAANQTYGFDIAASDWDPSLSDASTFERQSQLFLTQRAPRSELHPSIAGLGSIILADPSPSAPQ